jgi:protein SCO1
MSVFGSNLVRRVVRLACGLATCAALGLAPSSAAAGADDPVVPNELKHVNVTEHLDAQVPVDANFKDHTGKPVRLGQYFDGKRPVVLTFAYHSCPVLCSMVLNAATDGLRGVKGTVGVDFDVITISIDPKDTLEKTAAKRASILAEYKRPEADAGWHFLVGDEATIQRVTKAVGYEYSYDEEQQQYAHPAVIMLLKPSGKVSRYLYGIEYNPNDLKLGLLEASEGKSISTIDRVIMYCYRYDPHDGKYVIVATRLMQVGGIFTVLFLGGFLGIFWVRERAKSKKNALAALNDKQQVSNESAAKLAEATE